MTRVTRYQGAIIRDHHILLIRHRELATQRDYWLIPGGGREGSESEEQCVQREMKEETCLDVKVERLLLDEPAPSDGVYRQMNTYLCTAVNGKAHPGYEPEFGTGYEIMAVKWFDLRSSGKWEPSVLEDPITYPLLQRIRAALGYEDHQ